MHVVIMGCGRVGSEPPGWVERHGGDDRQEPLRRSARYQFKGSKIEGYGFDEDILREAGIEQAEERSPPCPAATAPTS